jgi:hypothetical protein
MIATRLDSANMDSALFELGLENGWQEARIYVLKRSSVSGR